MREISDFGFSRCPISMSVLPFFRINPNKLIRKKIIRFLEIGRKSRQVFSRPCSGGSFQYLVPPSDVDRTVDISRSSRISPEPCSIHQRSQSPPLEWLHVWDRSRSHSFTPYVLIRSLITPQIRILLGGVGLRDTVGIPGRFPHGFVSFLHGRSKSLAWRHEFRTLAILPAISPL